MARFEAGQAGSATDGVTLPYNTLTESSPELNKTSSSAPGMVISKLKLALFVVLLLILLVTVIALAVVLANSRAKAKEGTGSSVVNPTSPSSPVPTTPGADPWWQFRLPGDVIPTHYDLQLDVNDKQKRFTGRMQITVTVTQSTDLILLHCKEMNITTVEISGLYAYGIPIPIKKRFPFPKYEYYVIQMESRLEPTQYAIVMTYEAFIGKEVGLYKGDYKTPGGENITYIASQLAPTNARGVFPCFDEPGYKATFNISLAHRPDYFAVSNMPLMRTETKDGKKYDYFQKTPKMSTYLLAFLICDFNSVSSTTSDNVKLTIYAEPNKIAKAKYAQDITSKLLPFYSKYFGRAFPMKKADLAALNDFTHDLMENWGLMMVRELHVLWSQANSGEADKQWVAIDTGILLARQWFGNLVTAKWWDDYWIQVGFAEHIMAIAVDSIQPDWKIRDLYFIELVRESLAADGLMSSHPISINVTSAGNIEEIMDRFVSSKSGSLARMVEDYLGADVFQAGIKRFLRKNAFGSIEANDLWDAFRNETCSRGSCVDVKSMMDTWSLQMGYPVVTLKKTDATHFSASQTRFLFDKKANLSNTKYKSPFNYKWFIPFTFVTSSKPTTKVTAKLDKSDGVITYDGSSWIKGNYQHKGYYLVNYEDSNWDALAAQLKNNYTAFTSSDRAGLLQDISFLARGGIVKYSRVLSMTEYMKNEPDYVPWRSFDDTIGYMQGLLPKSSQAYKDLGKYLWFQTKNKYFQLGFADTGTTTDKIMREMILGIACASKEKTCLGNVTDLFKKWMQQPDPNPIPPDFRHLVYNYGILAGGAKEWDFAFNQYKTVKDASAKDAILHGLFGVQESWILRRFLDYAIDPRQLKSEEALHVIGDIALHNDIGRTLAWDFSVANWNTIMNRYATSGQLGWMIESLTRGMSTQYELDKLKKFADNKMHTGIVKRSFKKAVDRVTARIDWLSKNEADIATWVAKFVKDNSL